MKKFITATLLILGAAFLIPQESGAQTYQGNPFTDISYKFYPLASNRQFVASQGDSAIATPFRIGGAHQAAYVVTLSDTATVYVNVDSRTVGTTAWATTHRDTITWAPADSAGTTLEYPLRNTSVDYIGGMEKQVRLRLIFAASGQSVVNTTNNRYWLKLIWKD